MKLGEKFIFKKYSIKLVIINKSIFTYIWFLDLLTQNVKLAINISMEIIKLFHLELLKAHLLLKVMVYLLLQ